MTAIKGSVAIVTGASSGIGRAVAVELAARGAQVVGFARREQQVEETAAACRQHTTDSFAVVGDVGNADDCQRLVDTTTSRLGRVDIVVNNAGVPMRRHVAELTVADVEGQVQVNFLGAVRITLAALPGMLERRRGAIVNVTSVVAYVPNPWEAAYGAAKAALDQWTQGLSVDLHGTGVHAGVVSPGPIDTEIWGLLQAPPDYTGRRYDVQLVADAVAKLIERNRPHVTVPRVFGAVPVLYGVPGINRLLRRGLVRFGARANSS